MTQLLASLGRSLSGLFARLIPPAADEGPEKVRSGPTGRRPAFLPYVNEVTGETLSARHAYRLMLADPNIKSALLGKILAIAGLDLQVNPADKKQPADKPIAEFHQWMLTQRLEGGIPDLAWSILSGMLIDGFSICEKVTAVQDKGRWAGKHVLAALKAKRVGDEILPVVDEFGNITQLHGFLYNAGRTWDPKDFVILRYLPLYNSPVGMSDLRAAYRAYWIMDTTWKLRAIGLEKRAHPLLVGHWQSPQQKKALEEALEGAKSSNWMSAPADAKIEAIEIAGLSQDMFRNAIQDLREEIYLGIQGALLQALTSGEGAQRGNSLAHKDTADVFKWFVSAQLVKAINEQVVPDYTDRNFAGVQEYPRASLGGIDDAELAETLAIDTGLHAMGVDLSQEDIYERYGRRVPTDAQDILPGMPQKATPDSTQPPLPFTEGDGRANSPFSRSTLLTGSSRPAIPAEPPPSRRSSPASARR